MLEARDDIVLVRSGTNLGFGGGCNLAAEVASGRYLLFLNDDSTVEDGCVGHLVATAESDPTIGAVGGRIRSGDGTLQEAGSVLWDDGWAAHVGLGLPKGSTAYSYVRDVDYASANGLLVRRDAWDAVGGFDERYHPAYYEDVDLCLGLHHHGYRVVYEPRAGLRHLESQSSSYRYRYFLLIRNRRLLVEKWPEELGRFGDRPEVIDAGAVERAVALARRSSARLLWVVAGSAPATWEAVEAVAGDGRAVTVAWSGRAPGTLPFAPDRTSTADRLADLGVDLRTDDLRSLLAVTGAAFDLAVVEAGADWTGVPLVRPDGSALPVVRFDPGDRAVDIGSWAREVVDRVGTDDRARHDTGHDGPGPRPRASSPAQGDEGRRPVDGSDHDAQVLRELRSARSEIGVKDEFITSLESEIDDLERRLDEVVGFLQAKTSYIESLPSVRAKAWIDRVLRPPKE